MRSACATLSLISHITLTSIISAHAAQYLKCSTPSKLQHLLYISDKYLSYAHNSFFYFGTVVIPVWHLIASNYSVSGHRRT